MDILTTPNHFLNFKGKKPVFICTSDKRIYQVFGWKNPGKKLVNFIIIEFSSTFWTGSATLEVFMCKLEELTYSTVVFFIQ
jgi:hypothetical protein